MKKVTHYRKCGSRVGHCSIRRPEIGAQIRRGSMRVCCDSAKVMGDCNRDSPGGLGTRNVLCRVIGFFIFRAKSDSQLHLHHVATFQSTRE